MTFGIGPVFNGLHVGRGRRVPKPAPGIPSRLFRKNNSRFGNRLRDAIPPSPLLGLQFDVDLLLAGIDPSDLETANLPRSHCFRSAFGWTAAGFPLLSKHCR